MNTHKNFLLLGLIALGILVGGFLSFVTSDGVLFTGAAGGGLLGGLLYFLIQMIVSRRKREVLPYDHLDEQFPIHHENHQTLDSRVREMHDNVVEDIMHFPPLKH